MDIKFLTWNLKNNKDKNFFIELNTFVKHKQIDVIVLQECFTDFTDELSDFFEIDDFLNSKGKRWVRVFINKKSNINYDSATSYSLNKMRCAQLTTSKGFKFNLIGLHLYSEYGKSKRQQLVDNKEIPTYIQEFETKQKNDKTLIVGDINYRPFDIELEQADFINSNSDRNVIRLLKNKGLGEHNYRFFYNPMWNVLGDYDLIAKEQKPSGTYYWYPDDVEKYHWNLIDGALLSPTIMDNIKIETIKIHSKLNKTELVKTSINKQDETLIMEGISDHLPVTFSLKTN